MTSGYWMHTSYKEEINIYLTLYKRASTSPLLWRPINVFIFGTLISSHLVTLILLPHSYDCTIRETKMIKMSNPNRPFIIILYMVSFRVCTLSVLVTWGQTWSNSSWPKIALIHSPQLWSSDNVICQVIKSGWDICVLNRTSNHMYKRTQNFKTHAIIFSILFFFWPADK